MSAYADAGVDYSKIGPFKKAMIEAAKRTFAFPNRRNVEVITDLAHAHGGVFEYTGSLPHRFCQTMEGLGNKNWIAEWMLIHEGTGRTYYDDVMWCNVMMAVNDNIAQGALPIGYTDEVAVGRDSWFTHEQKAADLAQGCFEACRASGMALLAGESPALKYLLQSAPPVEAAPSLSGCVTGIIAPKQRTITGKNLRHGDRIIGFASSGLHANGISLVIKKALELPDQFLTKVPGGSTLGQEALIRTSCYVRLVETLLDNEVDIHALLPGTGSGVAKLAFDKKELTYLVYAWPKVPPLFLFMLELGVSLEDCLNTFNWGCGYYAFVPLCEVDRLLVLSERCGIEAMEVGFVKEGKRGVHFEPEGEKAIWLDPPAE